jgi:hypothetical protein
MARDNIKAIIERGLKIPAAAVINVQPAPKNSRGNTKVDRKTVVEQPKLRHAVTGHRTLTGTRR